MGCDYFKEIYINIIFYDPDKDWICDSTKIFHRILKKDRRLYNDINSIIKKYYVEYNQTEITLERQRGYLMNIPKDKTYSECLKESMKPIYQPRKIFEHGKGWNFKERFYDWNEDNINYIKDLLKKVYIMREDCKFHQINIPEKDIFEIWICEYNYER